MVNELGTQNPEAALVGGDAASVEMKDISILVAKKTELDSKRMDVPSIPCSYTKQDTIYLIRKKIWR